MATIAAAATVSRLFCSNVVAAVVDDERGEGRWRARRMTDKGRRGLILSAVFATSQVNGDSRTELLKKYLKKSEENKAKNDKERFDSYYKRNYKDYFGSLEGYLKQKKEQLSESEKGILKWLETNK